MVGRAADAGDRPIAVVRHSSDDIGFDFAASGCGRLRPTATDCGRLRPTAAGCDRRRPAARRETAGHEGCERSARRPMRAG
ncbi:hypothetical protein WS62_09850 [Burkholderia sp. ABCPW 14]|nr:hypothetical protein WS62_09850 [Burkholderia sp. ABCPW 14]